MAKEKKEKVRVHLLISGLVQGVFFRSYMQREARSLGLTGWVKNRGDGKVEAVVEGEKKAVEKIIQWAHRGSPMSRVEKVEVRWEEYLGEYDTFFITY